MLTSGPVDMKFYHLQNAFDGCINVEVICLTSVAAEVGQAQHSKGPLQTSLLRDIRLLQYSKPPPKKKPIHRHRRCKCLTRALAVVLSNYLATLKILRNRKPELPTPSALETASLAVVMSNYLATRKILRDEKPELPTPSASETASICHECPFALVSNAGPNYELSSKRQTVLNSTHPCLGKE
eukprot:scaffold16244_cov167-Skeletonema_dohrnii-CCMP3373.AAC.1